LTAVPLFDKSNVSMSDGLSKIGGISFVIIGALFFFKYLLDLMAGPPPSTGEEILAWVVSAKLPMSLVSESLFFVGGLEAI